MSGGALGTGSAALRAAATVGDTAACAKLLGSARLVRFSRDELGRSALHLAASAGHAPIIRLLLSVAAPKEVDSPDGAGCTALQRAAADGHEEVVRLLLARGADVDHRDSVHGNCALHEAAWKGYSRTVSLLATAGANLTRTNSGGFTALHLCCQNGHNQSCRELLLAGCNPDLQNNYGDTALHTAARYGHAGVTRILISAKCKISEQNKNGDTALHIAAAMGRRKLTRIFLEAGCNKDIRNKQNETARDIAQRKDLNEILNILEDCSSKKEKKSKIKKKSKSKVRFDGKMPVVIDSPIRSKHWSPYGCHYYPNPEAFPSPRLDTLPNEPLKRGEQYYLDLAGNIRKGPVGVGYTCYCAPLFRHLEARIEKDKKELQRAQIKLGQKVAGLEQRLNRNAFGRRSERVVSNRETHTETLSKSKSLEMLDKIEDEIPLQGTRSMDELDQADETKSRPSVKELVARIQQHQQQPPTSDNIENSESSDDEDNPLHFVQHKGLMGNSNMVSPEIAFNPNYENVRNGVPRSRAGVYSPTSGLPFIDSCTSYIEPSVQESNVQNTRVYTSSARIPVYQGFIESQQNTVVPPVRNFEPEGRSFDRYNRNYEPPILESQMQFYQSPSKSHETSAKNCESHMKPYEPCNQYEQSIGARFAKLRLLDNKFNKQEIFNSQKMFENTTRMLDNHEVTDRDTNNDSGYSTKVYGSSKGNSPCLSGQTDECVASSSLV